MSYFQYKVIDAQTLAASGDETFENCLNKLGKDGWDLLGDTVRHDAQTHSIFAIVRKETITKKEMVYT